MYYSVIYVFLLVFQPVYLVVYLSISLFYDTVFFKKHFCCMIQIIQNAI